jgi:hypothetical protein
MEEPEKPGETPRPGRCTHVSDAKIQANRINAQKSTGPRTPEGKRAACMGRTTHGLTAKTAVLPGESAEEFAQWTADWEAFLQAESGPERFLAGEAAHSSWRLMHSRDSERALISERREQATEELDSVSQYYEASLLAQGLPKNPTAVVLKLRQSEMGCQWLINQWRLIRWQLGGDESCLFMSQRLWGCYLLGARDCDFFLNHELREWNRFYLASVVNDELKDKIIKVWWEGRPKDELGYTDNEFVDRFNGMVEDALKIDWTEAKRLQREFIGRVMAELEARQTAIQERAARKRRRARRMAKVDDSPEGARRQRYITAHRRNVFASMEQARALRKERLGSQGAVQEPERPKEDTDVSEPPPADPITPQPPPAARPDEPGKAEVESKTPKGGRGLGGGVLPALVLLLLAPLWAGWGRGSGPQPHRAQARERAVALEPGSGAVGETLEPALVTSVGRHETAPPQGKPSREGTHKLRFQAKLDATDGAAALSEFDSERAPIGGRGARDSPGS